MIAQAVCVEVHSMLKTKQAFDPVRFNRNLKALPREPRE